MQTTKEHRNQEILLNLKAILTRKGLSQRDFANMLGKKESEVSRWFSGKFCISKMTQSKIECILQEPISSDSSFESDNVTVKIGIIGTGNIARRFASEMPHVQYGEIIAAFNPDENQLTSFCSEFNIPNSCNTIDKLLSLSDAVYIASPLVTHATYAHQCISHKKHVLCEMPFTPSKEEAKGLYQIARTNDCIITPALKTAFCPSFIQINEIAQSGIIGEIIDVSGTVTTLLPEDIQTEFYNERLLENATYPLLAIFKLFGTSYRKMHVFCKKHEDKIRFAKVSLVYEESIASLKVGVGVKSEGSLVISGTKGYIYVPAPWWKTDYFEVRFENQNDNKKYFFPYESSGLRYEIQAFIDSIKKKSPHKEYITKEENLKILEIQNKLYNNGK